MKPDLRRSESLAACRNSWLIAGALAVLLFGLMGVVQAELRWSVKLDGSVPFYQTTELGMLCWLGTEKGVLFRARQASSLRSAQPTRLPHPSIDV